MKILAEKNLRVESNEREEMLEILKKLIDEIEENEKKVNSFKRNDPIRVNRLEKDTKELLRLEEMVIYNNNYKWKDNIIGVYRWLKTKSYDLNISEMYPEMLPYLD